MVKGLELVGEKVEVSEEIDGVLPVANRLESISSSSRKSSGPEGQ